jgi:hypothetical protein
MKFSEARGNIGDMPEEDFWAFFDVVVKEAARRKSISMHPMWDTTGIWRMDFRTEQSVVRSPEQTEVLEHNTNWNIKRFDPPSGPAHMDRPMPVEREFQPRGGWHGHVGASGVIPHFGQTYDADGLPY